ncbi:MAG: hypothetical protein WAW37_11025 [Syntrophobacteraceae bacterium]
MVFACHFVVRFTARRCMALLSAAILIAACFGSVGQASAGPLRHNPAVVSAIDAELAAGCGDERLLAVLRGLRWCVVFGDDDANFDFTFANYVTMLDELTLIRPHPAVARIVHALILKEFERALPQLPKLFAADEAGYEDFLSILPVAYHHQAPLAPLKAFADRHFADITPPDRLSEFREAAGDRDYDLLTDLVVGAAFVDMAYRWGVDKDFRLPPNHYSTILAECAGIPFEAKFEDDLYHEQNYYATHVLLALNHYGQRPLTPSPTGDRVFQYLAGQYDTVRHRVGDLDLICEYLYCFRQFAPAGIELIEEGERHILSLQRTDGSWGTREDFEGDPYDRLHPTWTAITLLVQGTE